MVSVVFVFQDKENVLYYSFNGSNTVVYLRARKIKLITNSPLEKEEGSVYVSST